MNPSAPGPQKKTIMLVEDNKALRDAFREILEAAGYEVLSAANGREALALYHEKNLEVNLLVSDINMPEMSGIELAVILRQANPNIKVVIMSGLAPSGAVQQNYPVPIESWLQKPIGMKIFLQTINDLMRGEP